MKKDDLTLFIKLDRKLHISMEDVKRLHTHTIIKDKRKHNEKYRCRKNKHKIFDEEE